MQQQQRYTAYEAQVWARRQRFGGDPSAKIILMLLSDYADEWGTCYPGVDRIAEETEQSRSTVLRKLKVLAEVGLITIERRANDRGHRTSNRYILEIGKAVTAREWFEASERVKARVGHPSERPEEVQGVNVTPGSPAPPKSHAERGSKVSPDDTGTTSGTTSYPLTPPVEPDQPILEAPAGAQGVLSLVGSSAPPEPVPAPQIAFTAFWEMYPRKTGKLAAERAFAKAARTTSLAAIMGGLEAACADWRSHRTEQRFIPHPASWLNAGRWADEHDVAEEQPNPWANVPSASEVYARTVGQ